MVKRILIVEDENEIANFISRKLKLAEYEPVIASNGEEGLAFLSGHKTDVILTDMIMPVMDGMSFCKNLKDSQDLSHIPVIAFSGVEDEGKNLKEIGINTFLNKPFSFETLLNTIEDVLSEERGRPKRKKVLTQCQLNPALTLALKQFHDFGYNIDLKTIHDNSTLVEETLRELPDILIIDAFDQNRPILNLIKSLRSYALLKNMILIVYISHEDDTIVQKRRWLRNKPVVDNMQELCRKAGATEFVGLLNRESFLSVLFKYCRTDQDGHDRDNESKP